MTSADSSRMMGIEGVGTMELVDVSGLLRMGGDYLLVPVCRSVGDGFTGKGKSDVWVYSPRFCLIFSSFFITELKLYNFFSPCS